MIVTKRMNFWSPRLQRLQRGVLISSGNWSIPHKLLALLLFVMDNQTAFFQCEFVVG